MATKRRPPFDPKSFLAKIGEGRLRGPSRQVTTARKRETWSIGRASRHIFTVAQGSIRRDEFDLKGYWTERAAFA
jgi:hypothetical protein